MMYFDKTLSHFVLQSQGSTERTAKVAIFRANIQPASDTSTAMIDGQYGRTFNVFTTYSGLNINDVLTTSGTTTYSGERFIVKGVKPYAYGPLRHFEVLITKPEV